MARILVFYATTDGHTARIAEAIAGTLRTHGAIVDVVEARSAAGAQPDPADYTAVVVAASVHAGRHQRSVTKWVRAHARVLDGRQTAFVSVCLGVLQSDPAVQHAVAATVVRFTAETGWNPGVTKVVAGALLYTRYRWLTRMMMKGIAGKAGGATDTSRDYDYTDWQDLERFSARFAGIAAAAKAA
jgi:menaquinone-dependent protoporphyrinogen oxidase